MLLPLGLFSQVLIHAPSVRHFGTAFILNHFNKRRHLSTQAYFFGTSTAVLVGVLSFFYMNIPRFTSLIRAQPVQAPHFRAVNNVY